MTPQLTREQRNTFGTVITTSAMENKRSVYMIDAPAGTGKTFTECAVAAHLRARAKLVLCATSTGLAALILPGG
ncbi:unnamed protein product, partial [Ectocarpus sp. 6 AP-2014]